MIHIPVAVPNKAFKWQISLFEFAMRWVYGEKAMSKALIAICDRNDHNKVWKNVDWNIGLPYKLVPGIHKALRDIDRHNYFSAGNVFFALRDILPTLLDDDIVCLQDADIIPLRPYDGPIPQENQIFTCNRYEDWHMLSTKPSKKNFDVIEPHLKHDDYRYMEGGFVPIIARVSTFKKIIDDVISTTIKIVREQQDNERGWWCQMYAFNTAVHNHKLEEICLDLTYFPGLGGWRGDYAFAHYSCDPKFKKSDFPRINYKAFPDNDGFYSLVLEWLYR